MGNLLHKQLTDIADILVVSTATAVSYFLRTLRIRERKWARWSYLILYNLSLA